MPEPAQEAYLEHELKLLLPAGRLPTALTMLRALCREDPHHPANIVVSIYYDTRGFDLLQDKIDSQRYKTKVRLRWYEEPNSAPPSSASYAELKYRHGSRRRKIRRPTSLVSAEIRGLPLHHGDQPDISAHLPPGVFSAPHRLLPCVTVRYHRRRFIDPLSRTRISLDSLISVNNVNPRLLPNGSPRRLEPAIIELKNASGEIPGRLRGLLHCGAHLASFSKYASAVVRARQPF